MTSGAKMALLKFVISLLNPSKGESTVISELVVATESTKRLTTVRVAKALAYNIPQFRRRKGRYSTMRGLETLPVLEETPEGWRAWRLDTGDDKASGYEPPLLGRVGKANSTNNPFADRSKGIWECVDITEVPSEEQRDRPTSED